MAASSKLGDLPISVVHQMCKHLNVEGAGVKNWKDLIAQPQVSYDMFAVDSFAHSGLRPHTSPAEQVFNDFIAQGITVDQLYEMLEGIQALACRDLLEPYISRSMVESRRSSGNHRDQGTLPFLPDGGVASPDSTPSPDEHPKYGVLPSVAPPTSAHSDTKTYHDNYHRSGTHEGHFHGNRFHESSYSSNQCSSMGYNSGPPFNSHLPPVTPTSHLPPAPPISHLQSTLPTSHLPQALPPAQLPPPPAPSHFIPAPPTSDFPPPPLTHYPDSHQVVSEGGVSVGIVDEQLPLHRTAEVLFNAGVPSADSLQAVTEHPQYYGNQPHPPDQQYQVQQQQQQLLNGGYVPHPSYVGHMIRTPSDGSTNYSSEGSGYISSDQRSEYISYDQRSGYTSSDQRSGYVSSGQRSGYASSGQTTASDSLDHSSQYSVKVGSKYNSASQGSESSNSDQGSRLTSEMSSMKSSSASSKDKFGGLNILHFSYTELSEATGGFTRGLIGIGSFGTVFKAEVRNNGPYAVKKLHSERELGEHCVLYDSFHRESFQQELQLLTRYHHRNILSLVAYSNDGCLPCLVYDFMECGSLSECLQEKRGVRLSWDRRLRIASAVADALHFLHTVNAPDTTLVHGDVKSANILLDKHLSPKLSDFGLACELSTRSSRSSTTFSSRSAVVRGTMAYMAPEFLRNRKLTTRTDVYAYGVVLLELHTGLPALSEDHTQEEEPVLTERLYELLEDSDSHRSEVVRVADGRAGWPEEIGVALFDIITVCLHKKMNKRLPIKQVLDQLATLLPP